MSNLPEVPELSEGALERIWQSEEVEKPIFQILEVEKTGDGSLNCFHCLISDGKHCNSDSWILTELNPLHAVDELAKFTIVQCDKYFSLVNSKCRRILVISELRVLAKSAYVGRRLGNPTAVTAPIAEAPVDWRALLNNRQMETSNNASSMNQSLNSQLTPIASLRLPPNVICVRVLEKCPKYRSKNAKGIEMLSMHLKDVSGEILATAFKEQAEKFFNEIVPSYVYYISKFQLCPVEQKNLTIKNNFEIIFTPETVVQKCDEYDKSMPNIKYNMIPIAQIPKMEYKAAVDTIGICKKVGDLKTFTAHTTKWSFQARDLLLIDQNDASVELRLWGDEAESFNCDKESIIFVKRACIQGSLDGAKSLQMETLSLLIINPDIPECHDLKRRLENDGDKKNSIINKLKKLTVNSKN